MTFFTEQEGYYNSLYQQYPDFYPSQQPPPTESFITSVNSSSLEMNQIAHQGKIFYL